MDNYPEPVNYLTEDDAIDFCLSYPRRCDYKINTDEIKIYTEDPVPRQELGFQLWNSEVVYLAEHAEENDIFCHTYHIINYREL